MVSTLTRGGIYQVVKGVESMVSTSTRGAINQAVKKGGIYGEYILFIGGENYQPIQGGEIFGPCIGMTSAPVTESPRHPIVLYSLSYPIIP